MSGQNERVKVIFPEHGKSGDAHMGRTGAITSMDKPNGRATVTFDDGGQVVTIDACCLQLLGDEPTEAATEPGPQIRNSVADLGLARYAALPVTLPAVPVPCGACHGLGVTGERYEMPTDNGPTLLVEVICPTCETARYPDDDEHPADDGEVCGAAPYPSGSKGDDGTECLLPAGHEGPHDDQDTGSCPSCHGLRWWPAQSFAAAEPTVMVTLRVPCGCAAELLATGDDPSILAPYPLIPAAAQFPCCEHCNPPKGYGHGSPCQESGCPGAVPVAGIEPVS